MKPLTKMKPPRRTSRRPTLWNRVGLRNRQSLLAQEKWAELPQMKTLTSSQLHQIRPRACSVSRSALSPWKRNATCYSYQIFLVVCSAASRVFEEYQGRDCLLKRRVGQDIRCNKPWLDNDKLNKRFVIAYIRQCFFHRIFWISSSLCCISASSIFSPLHVLQRIGILRMRVPLSKTSTEPKWWMCDHPSWPTGVSPKAMWSWSAAVTSRHRTGIIAWILLAAHQGELSR